LPDAPPISLLAGLVRIEYLENPGVTLGLGADLPVVVRQLVFVVAVGVLLLAIVTFALRGRNLSVLQVTGLAIVAAGGIGNVIDRLFNNGAVIDFISFGVGEVRTGVMNVADVAVFGGMALILLSTHARFGRKPKPT
jgi:signal peptidase II